jgi:response regulator RpfG family c-di-GMP phosphodiesterase
MFVDDNLSIGQENDFSIDEIRQFVEQKTKDILLTQDVAIFTLAKVAESRDQVTGGHLYRIRAYSQSLAEELRREGCYSRLVNAQFLEDLYRASPLHDIGKVGIPDTILLKRDQLTPVEFERMQQHTIIGANILDQAVGQSPCAGFLKMAAAVARFHHERFDGSGYPAGLVGREIPLPARIVALADVFDALTTERPYKAAQSPSRARQIIQSESGRHFDPAIVCVFQNRFAEFLQILKAQREVMPLAVGAMSFREYENVIAE